MEWAFRGPALLRERLGGELTANKIHHDGQRKSSSPFSAEVGAAPLPCEHGPATPTRCASCCRRTTTATPQRCGRPRRLGEELFARLAPLPRVRQREVEDLVAILAKRMGVTPNGWERVAGPLTIPSPGPWPTSTAPRRSRRSGSGRRRRRRRASPSRTDAGHPAAAMKPASRSSARLGLARRARTARADPRLLPRRHLLRARSPRACRGTR